MTATLRAGALAASIASTVAVLLFPATARAADPDPWFGQDKALHFGVSVGLAAGGYGVSAIVLNEKWQRALAGASFSLTLGAGKELYDLSGHGDPSWKDFTWDVVGTAVGIGIALLVDTAASSSTSNLAVRRTQLAIAF
jgi:putative lipoprotein